MRHLLSLAAATFLLSGCVGNELRRASSLTATEVQSYNVDLARFDKMHRGIIEEMGNSARDNIAIASANEDLIGARLTELKASNQSEAVALFEAATPPVPATSVEATVITPPKWNSGAQDSLLKALNEVSAKRTTGQSAELLLKFVFDTAKGMKKRADEAAKTDSTDGK